MSEVRTLSVPQRFCGPPRWANGGFSCGSFAAGIDGAAEVTLRKPIPLDQQILIEADGDGYTATGDDGELLAEARPAAALDGLRPPARPSIEEAAAASADSPFRGPDHTYPGCFVCGPQHPDGLEIFVGPLERGADDPEAFADRFTIDPALAEDDGNAGPGLVWAALDCPSFVPPFWAYAPVLLGRLTAEQLSSRCPPGSRSSPSPGRWRSRAASCTRPRRCSTATVRSSPAPGRSGSSFGSRSRPEPAQRRSSS